MTHAITRGLFYSVALASLLLSVLNISAHAEQPNIVVIMADDIGLGDISFHNKKIINNKPVVMTANIDQLAEQGVWFSDAHSATALCAPTRYAMMTGKNNYRSYAPWGVWGAFRPNAVTDEDATIARVAADAGYTTGFVGKWHLGGDFKLKNSDKIYRGDSKGELPNIDLTRMLGGGPNDLGFDYSFMLPDGIQGPIYLAYEDQNWYPLSEKSSIILVNEETTNDIRTISSKGEGMGDSAWETTKLGYQLANKAANFISKQKKNTPFFLYYASPMAHLPHMPPKTFDGKVVAGKTPSHHLDMVYELDMQVGHIVKALKENNMFDNTLIIFTSDNGGLGTWVSDSYKSGHKGSGGFRGYKNDAWEGGHRVPFIVHWPKQVKPAISAQMVLIQDVLATVSAASGNALGTDVAPDSNNLLPLVTQQTGYSTRQFAFLQSGTGNEVIFRDGNYKLTMKSNREQTEFTPVALYDLGKSPTEDDEDNLIERAAYKGMLASMKAKYINVMSGKGPTRPSFITGQ